MKTQVLAEYTLASGQTVSIVKGDLTAEVVDAIVNAANERLQHGGGVAGAIRRAGGPNIQRESAAWVAEHGPVRTGTAAITGAGELPAEYVIHAVGPRWGKNGREAELASAVQSALKLADEQNLHSVSIPGISSGIFGGPKDICARTILQATQGYLEQNSDTSLQAIRFCNIDQETASIFETEARQLLE